MAKQLQYKTGFFVCIVLVLLLMFKIYIDGSYFTLQKTEGDSEVHLDNYEDLFHRLISRNSSLNSTILDKDIFRLFIWPQSTLSSMNTTDIKKFLDQKVYTSDHNKVNTLFSDTFTIFFLYKIPIFLLLYPESRKLEKKAT